MAAQHPAPIQLFLDELAKLNTLARFVKEAPVPTDRVDDFYAAFEDSMPTVQKVQKILSSWEFFEALKASCVQPEALPKAHIRYWAKSYGVTPEEYEERFYGDSGLEGLYSEEGGGL